MRINIWCSPGNDNMEGEILFYLVDGNKKQAFKRTLTIINSGPNWEGKYEDMKKECLNGLINRRLKELMWYLNKQLEQKVINVDGMKLEPLSSDWKIE